ncbi:GAF domain-containing protein [Myxococcota bacterium]|nr:GAF domain-containing protein [Myxococcota bacterium]
MTIETIQDYAFGALEEAPVLIAVFDLQRSVVFANRAYREAAGLAREEILGRKCFEIWGLGKSCEGCPVVASLTTGEPAQAEMSQDNQSHWSVDQGAWLCRAAPLSHGEGALFGAVLTAVSISRRTSAEARLVTQNRRQRMIIDILQFPSGNLQSFLDHALNKAIELTESRIGYIYFYDEDTREFTLNTWSRDVMKECAVVNPQTKYELDRTGIWGEAVRQRQAIVVNDFTSPDPLKKGIPEGHVRLERFLTIPVFQQERIVAVIGVANKQSDYDETDELQLTLLMDAVWKSVEVFRGRDALVRSDDQFRNLFEEMLDGFALHEMIFDAQGNPADYRFLAVNPAFERMTGLSAGRIIGRTVLEVMPGIEPHWIETYGKVVQTGEPVFFENFAAGLGRTFEVKAYRCAPGQFTTIFVDVTESRRVSLGQETLREQLAQARKMESIGRLAGGVAHDFNNMLNIILSNAELVIDDVPLYGQVHEAISEIQKAARRSAALTAQLLAFARKQPVVPRRLDLNARVEGMLKMLGRLIGEDIELVWLPGAGIGTILMDPSQLDQVLANLCVNSRDAIEGSGRITIETADVDLAETDCATMSDTAVPGPYVMLKVSDTGQGMDEETRSRLFEPFFTTKALGKGTGLGLATIHGIVSQNNGSICVRSEVGEGTTFRIFLPRQIEPTAAVVPEAAHADAFGTETLLLVEDEPEILHVARRILERHGYRVLIASTPAEAIRQATGHAAEIRLLVSDVIMPEMNGRDLAGRLGALIPGLKCLFMSGYTADYIAHHGVLDEGVHFIQKPFTKKAFTEMVRLVLDS